MKVIKIIFKTIMWLLVLVLLLLNVYSFMSVKVFGNNLTDFNGKAPLEVVSGSMEPTIKVGDMIIIDTKVKDYKVDDIVTFVDVNGSFVTHRIIEEKENGFVTKGDNNDSIDQELVTEDNIVGVYQFRIKGLGVILTSIKSPITFVIILVIGIILCVLASTDKDGKPVDVDDDYLEFLEYKKNSKKKKKDIKVETEEIPEEPKVETVEEPKGEVEEVLEEKVEVVKTVSEEKPKKRNYTKNNKTNNSKKYYNKNKESSDKDTEPKKTSNKKTGNSTKKSYNTKKTTDEKKVSSKSGKTTTKKTTTKKTTKSASKTPSKSSVTSKSATSKKKSSTSTKKTTKKDTETSTTKKKTYKKKTDNK